jgi:2-keto-4-pentenoate hydratase/2-oxohepta-3-ene-1,7-dioic acid hydratase in catechol pathway
VTRLGSVKARGARRAALIEESRVLVAASGSLDDVVRGGGLPLDGVREHRPDDVELDAPLRPPVLLCCGQNYRSHLAEQGRERRDAPEFFVKAGITIAAPGEPFLLDRRRTAKLDYETELGLVLGRDVFDVDPEEALEAVFGYVVVNDLSARDHQIKEGGRSSHGGGKNFDGATRLGRWVVPAAEVGDPQRLRVRTWVNGELRQSDTTANMVFSCAELISAFSRALTIPAGVIVATGTPGGTGLGCDTSLGGTGATPPGCVAACYLEAGDVVVSEIENVGSITFEVVEQT